MLSLSHDLCAAQMVPIQTSDRKAKLSSCDQVGCERSLQEDQNSEIQTGLVVLLRLHGELLFACCNQQFVAASDVQNRVRGGGVRRMFLVGVHVCCVEGAVVHLKVITTLKSIAAFEPITTFENLKRVIFIFLHERCNLVLGWK